MTDTTPITDGAGASQPIGTLEHLDPRSLTLELNVRDVADLDAEFLASIKEHGVLVPIAAVRDGRHRAPTGAGGKHLPTLTRPPSRKQPMTASQQPINPSHELRNTHPPKLT
jgi:hypothetical protein